MKTTRDEVLKTAAQMLLDQHHAICDRAREAGKVITAGEALRAAKAVCK